MATRQTSIDTSNELLEHLFQQTREGKLSLISLIRNFPDRSSSHLPTVISDDYERYIPLNDGDQLFEHDQMALTKEILRDHSTLYALLQQRTHSGDEKYYSLIQSRLATRPEEQ